MQHIDKKTRGYTCAVLTPSRVEGSEEKNNTIFESGPVYGIGVTEEELAERCVANIDLQYTDGRSVAAIEVAARIPLPPKGTTLAILRADLGSVGAMAILNMRMKNKEEGRNTRIPEHMKLLDVATADKRARRYPGPRPLPTRERPWGAPGQTEAEEDWILAAIAAEVADSKVPIETRVRAMEEWLETDKESKQYRKQVEQEREYLIYALGSGEIRHRVHRAENGNIAIVETGYWAATKVGYCLAPVVVACNPNFEDEFGNPRRKFTICTYPESGEGHADIRGILNELNRMEEGWTRSAFIDESLQGVSSSLDVETVVSVVEKHLTKKQQEYMIPKNPIPLH